MCSTIKNRVDPFDYKEQSRHDYEQSQSGPIDYKQVAGLDLDKPADGDDLYQSPTMANLTHKLRVRLKEYVGDTGIPVRIQCAPSSTGWV